MRRDGPHLPARPDSRVDFRLPRENNTARRRGSGGRHGGLITEVTMLENPDLAAAQTLAEEAAGRGLTPHDVRTTSCGLIPKMHALLMAADEARSVSFLAPGHMLHEITNALGAGGGWEMTVLARDGEALIVFTRSARHDDLLHLV